MDNSTGIGANNTKHPPSAHAKACLSRAADRPYPAQEVNFTVRDKLLAFGYAELVDRPSPYTTHKKGRTVPFLVVTMAGLRYLGRTK
jgi:hypothetical protein